MSEDEQAIRDLIATWLRATAVGNLQGVLNCMDDDVVFLLPGQQPMRGKENFAAGFKSATQNFRIMATSDIEEIQVAGEWAYCWTRLKVTMMPKQSGSSQRRAGHTLTILRKNPEGRWLVIRDANLLTPEA